MVSRPLCVPNVGTTDCIIQKPPKRISVILPNPEDEESDAESRNATGQDKLLYEIR